MHVHDYPIHYNNTIVRFVIFANIPDAQSSNNIEESKSCYKNLSRLIDTKIGGT